MTPQTLESRLERLEAQLRLLERYADDLRRLEDQSTQLSARSASLAILTILAGAVYAREFESGHLALLVTLVSMGTAGAFAVLGLRSKRLLAKGRPVLADSFNQLLLLADRQYQDLLQDEELDPWRAQELQLRMRRLDFAVPDRVTGPREGSRGERHEARPSTGEPPDPLGRGATVR